MASKEPEITLYFLGASRAIRIAWLLEELSLPYELVSSPRASNGLAPPEFKAKIPTKLGKSPVIKDGNIVIQESAAIAEYICETYDTSCRLLPKEPAARAKVREWMSAAEGTFMIHGLAILYARWSLPEPAKEYLPEMEKGLSTNVHNDFDWFESELEGKEYLVGKTVTAADILMGFNIEFIFARKLGTEGGDWPNVTKWLSRVQQREAYKKAVEKSGYSL
ncbi:glutathione S-transferase [Exophiala viscosa]|uniref:glutathione S-transferase n=1 Tax=Exophiala viscosa TaxID=2486360 RepID=UPI00219F5E1D|nr:glutathione S-transferase [Exophiala viscosa]